MTCNSVGTHYRSGFEGRADIYNPLVTEKVLSGWLGISLPTLQRMRSKGGGPKFVRLGLRRVGYRPSDVESWLAARATERIGEQPTRTEAEATLAGGQRHNWGAS